MTASAESSLVTAIDTVHFLFLIPVTYPLSPVLQIFTSLRPTRKCTESYFTEKLCIMRNLTDWYGVQGQIGKTEKDAVEATVFFVLL